MFRCENEHCNIVVPPRQPVNKIVTERRERTYEKKIIRGKDKGKVKEVYGWEIVKEIDVCPKCYRVLTGKTPKVVQEVKKPEFENKPKHKPRFDKNKKKPWKNPTNKKNQQQKDSPKRNTEKKVIQQRKKPVVEVINPIKIVKE